MPKGKPLESGPLGKPIIATPDGSYTLGTQGKPICTLNSGTRKPPSGGTGTVKPEQGQSKPNTGSGS